MRVVSLVPSLTDTVVALAGPGVLVGRTRYCVEPRDGLAGVPTCGGTKNPDLDRVIALAPDLVLTCEEENKPEHVQALRDAGLRIHQVMPRKLDDVAVLLADLGDLLDARDRAAAARTALAAARDEAADAGGGQRAAALIWREPWMAVGGNVHAHAVLEALGLTNVLADRFDYPELTLDALRSLAPDLLLLPDEPFPFRDKHVRELAAAGVVAHQSRLLLLDGKLLTWYGTRTAPSLRILAARLRSLS